MRAIFKDDRSKSVSMSDLWIGESFCLVSHPELEPAQVYMLVTPEDSEEYTALDLGSGRLVTFSSTELVIPVNIVIHIKESN